MNRPPQHFEPEFIQSKPLTEKERKKLSEIIAKAKKNEAKTQV